MSDQKPEVYPQAQPFGGAELAAFLARPLIAKLCTHNPDGTIHIAPIYFKWEDGVVLMGTQEVTQKVKNIQRDDRVTVLIDEDESPFVGVIIYGTAKLSYEEVIPTRAAIFSQYKPVEAAQAQAERLASSWKPVIIRVTPQRMITYDYSKGFGISTDADAPGEDIF